jgi:hypothetical protein
MNNACMCVLFTAYGVYNHFGGAQHMFGRLLGLTAAVMFIIELVDV